MIGVKICGITRYEDAISAINYGADALGFVFAESKRRIDPIICREIISKLPPFVYTVGVFMDNDVKYINKILENCFVSALQFHGKEDESFCLSFKRPVIKAFSIKSYDDLSYIDDFPNIKNILIDGSKPGSGNMFDHNLLKNIDSEKKIILAGGLNPDNISNVLSLNKVCAVDVSSGVEDKPGIKNPLLIKKFIQTVKKWH